MSRIAKPHIASMNPKKWLPEFDVIRELSENRDEYVGSEWITLYSFPAYLRTCIDRIRARVLHVSKPGISITASCCMSNGIHVLMSHPDVSRLLDLKLELDRADDVDAGDLEEMNGWFRSFPLSVPDAAMTGSRRQNIVIPEEIKKQLCEFSSDLGVSSSLLATFSIMVTLSNQPAVLKEHRRMLNQSVDLFTRRAYRRRRLAELIVSMLG